MNTPSPVAATNADRRRRWLWPIVKWGLFATVLVFVGLRARALWKPGEFREISVSPLWLIAAAAAYLAGWLPSAWYWRRVMSIFGERVTVRDAARAYFCGHLGKYVPGKAGVLLIRAGLLKGRGHSAAVAAVTATFETLLMMGAGLAIGLALFPLTNWPPAIAGRIPHPLLLPLGIAIAIGISLPVIAMLLRKFAAMMTPRDLAGEKRVDQVDVKLVVLGLAAFCISWPLHGLSLGCTLAAFDSSLFDLHDWPMWTGATALSASVGFLAIFAPGGLGVREAVLTEVLRIQPAVGQGPAVIAAWLLRLVWFSAEILAAAGLYWVRKR
jgi:glycosyltransferase 2 family protein